MVVGQTPSSIRRVRVFPRTVDLRAIGRRAGSRFGETAYSSRMEILVGEKSSRRRVRVPDSTCGIASSSPQVLLGHTASCPPRVAGEIGQTYVDGRHGSTRDVILDWCGIVLGLVVIQGVRWVVRCRSAARAL